MDVSLPFTVSAPASSGNLGPGFDVLAMALDLRNRVKVVKGTGTVTLKGRDADTLPTDSTNLVARAFEQAAGQSIAAAGVDLRCDNRIPPARGLGSSTAAAACGLVAGWTVAGHEWDEDELFTALAALDGHPDNAAACAHGGIVLCRGLDGDEIDVVALGAADWLTPLAFVPDRELSTAESRAVVPTSYAREDVVRAIAATGMLVGGLIGGHVELVEDALHGDVLHEPHRAALVPELAEIREAASHTNALGATLSGAGPTVLVWCTPEDIDQAHGALSIDFPEAEMLTLRCADSGARVDG
jgi:homoserine kinase